jgi:hypothetical protein
MLPFDAEDSARPETKQPVDSPSESVYMTDSERIFLAIMGLERNNRYHTRAPEDPAT